MGKKIRTPQKSKDYAAHLEPQEPEWKERKRKLRLKHIKKKVKYKQKLFDEDIR